jgi:4-amino-4-deoxy-L-arabinose transferase-like glycosyltransferase
MSDPTEQAEEPTSRARYASGTEPDPSAARCPQRGSGESRSSASRGPSVSANAGVGPLTGELSAVRRVALLLFAAGIAFAGAHVPEIGSSPDESLYFAVASEMAERQAWLTPTLQGAPTWYKPPLMYWAARPFFALLGESALAARIPPLLCTLGVSLLLGSLARRFYGRSSEPVAIVSAVTALGSMKFGRLFMMDMPLTFAVALGAYGSWRAVTERRPPFLLLVGMSAGGGALLKGPAGTALVVLPVLAFCCLSGPRILATRWSLAATALALVVAAPWYAASLAAHGRAFIDFFFIRENLGKFAPAWTPWGLLRLVASLLAFALPWTLWAVPRRGEISVRDLRWRWALTGIGSMLLVYALPSVRLLHYSLPALPFVLVLAARPHLPRWAVIGTAGLLALGAVLLVLSVRWSFDLRVRIALALASVCLGFAARALWRGGRVPSALAVGLAWMLLLGIAAPALIDPTLPQTTLEAAGKRHIVTYRLFVGGQDDAPARRIGVTWTREELAAALDRGDAVVVPAQALPGEPFEGAGVSVIARWQRLGRVIAFETVRRSWLAGDPSMLNEEMVLVARGD